MMNRNLLGNSSTHEPEGAEVQEILKRKEQVVQGLLLEHKGGRFLEIGIGEFPVLPRLKLIIANGISYTGCDFQAVCESHALQMKVAGIDVSRITFAGNSVGTYAWTLFEMLERGERYDCIYLDGHHTFYVDLPALELAHLLLRPGGQIMVDDIQWTLSLLKRNMARRFTTWCFYRDMYDFSSYTRGQAVEPHLKRIVQKLLVDEYRYERENELSSEWWWVLRKPMLDGSESKHVRFTDRAPT